MFIFFILLVISENDKDKLGFETNPTTGFDTNTIRIQGKDYFINEVGSSMVSNWHKFILDAQSIIFMVDLQNQSQMASSMMEFELILNVMSDVTEKNLLIIFNKQDRHNEITDKQFIEGFFNLDELLEQYPNLNVIYASALKGLNCQEIYTWVTNVLTGKIITQVKKKKTQCGCFF